MERVTEIFFVLLPRCVLFDWLVKQCIVLNALRFAIEDWICVRKDKPKWRPGSCLWEKSKPFWSLEKRRTRSEPLPKHWGSLVQQLEMSWKRKKRHTKRQQSNRLTKENNSCWEQKHCESCEERTQSVTSQTISTEDIESSNIEAIPQYANHSSVVRIRGRDYNLHRSTKMSHKSHWIWSICLNVTWDLYAQSSRACVSPSRVHRLNALCAVNAGTHLL